VLLFGLEIHLYLIKQ